MATAERPTLTTADDRAWDLFFEALDVGSASSADLPPGAAIVAADAPDLNALVRRYHADRRTVVVVYKDGHREIRRPRQVEKYLLGGLLLVAAWLAVRHSKPVAH